MKEKDKYESGAADLDQSGCCCGLSENLEVGVQGWRLHIQSEQANGSGC